MAAIARRRRAARPEYWPAFVDVLTNLLLVFIFLLSLFTLTQFFLNREITGKDTLLDRLQGQIAQLNDLLALERAKSQESLDTIATLEASLSAIQADRTRLNAQLATARSGAQNTGEQIATLTDQLNTQRQANQRALSQVELLNQQLAALRQQIAALELALQASEARDRESQVRIADLGSRLNIALAERVQELERYRSDFFGRLRQIIGDRPGIQIVGDRFVFQSEVLFPSGSDQINDNAKSSLDALAAAVLAIQQEIPKDISWVLRVDGHTDRRPIVSARFRSNWELSAARAISVVRYLADRGVSPRNLLAAGFGEFQPVDNGDTEDAFSRNRRIELKLTER
ncbi:MAG: peptidoglycan -binding protein [Bauldia sp.]